MIAQKRFVTIWFCELKTDWFIRRNPLLAHKPLVLTLPFHGKKIVTGLNMLAEQQGIYKGMSVADAKAIFPQLNVEEDDSALAGKLLHNISEWCIRFTPAVAIDLPDGIILDATGCAHLWGGEEQYIADIKKRFAQFGYHVRIGMADTIGAAWAVAHFGIEPFIIECGKQTAALLPLPVAVLRIDEATVIRLEKLGFRTIGSCIHLPRPSLRRRFGLTLLSAMDKATGNEEEFISLIHPVSPFHERLLTPEPIITYTGIEIALKKLLEKICLRMKREQKGLRSALFICYRTDGKIERKNIGTTMPSCNRQHLFTLFENKITTIAPGPGIELFVLEANQVDAWSPSQSALWKNNMQDTMAVAELIDRIRSKMDHDIIKHYEPAEHYWPEHAFTETFSLEFSKHKSWRTGRPRPLYLLELPEQIEVTAPIPDYPPMLFRYKGTLHKIVKADGPERIEQEWWLQTGRHRDYYYVEDETGKRYWLFRAGHYDSNKNYQWFIHGFFS